MSAYIQCAAIHTGQKGHEVVHVEYMYSLEEAFETPRKIFLRDSRSWV